MDLQQLRYVAAVYRERHFVRAAALASISQPTLSQQIKKLERELGAALFERSPQGVRVTPAGERFILQAMIFLESLDGAVDDIRSRAAEIAGRIRLAVIPTVAPYLLPRVLPFLREKAPKLTLELNELTTSILLEQLKGGRVDLGVLALPIADKGYLTRSFGTEPFYLAAASGHLLAKKKSVAVRDILKERLLILQEGHCFRNQSLEFCKLTAQDPRVIFEGSGLTSVMRLAAGGEGVTLVPRMAAEEKINPGLRFIPFEKPAPTRELGVIWRTATPLSRGHQLVMDALEKAFQKFPGG